MRFSRILNYFCLYGTILLTALAAPVDSNFAVDSIQFGNGKTKIAFDTAGRMYATEKRGRVLLFNPDGSGGFQSPSVLIDIVSEVDSGLEAGLLGFEVDPNHATNRFIYLFYTTPEEELWDGTGDQRLVRYTMNASFDGIESGSETVLLSGLPRIINFHKAGEIAIHPLNPYAIFVALGDDDQIGGGGTLPQNLDSYVGKILRVDASTGLGLPDNPHYDGNADSIRSRVWASGMRNPFRFDLHPDRADMLFISENGDSNDRVAMVKAGGNGLWNGNDNGGFLTVDTPTFKVLLTTSPSLIGIEIVTAGPFAHNGHPTLYLGNWLDGISRFTLSDSTDAQDNEWDTMTSIPGGGASYWDSATTAMDLDFAADGHLYYTQTGGNAAEETWFPLRRYRYAGGTPSSADFTISPTGSDGVLPYGVNFSDTSTAGTHSISSWDWDFGDGASSDQQNPSHTYTEVGAYTASLTVTDSVGLTSSSEQSLVVTLDTPVTLSLAVWDGRTLPEEAANSAFTISLYQNDATTPLAFNGGSGIHGNQFNTLADGTYSGLLNLPLTGTAFVMILEPLSPPGFQAATRGVSVNPGASNTVTENFYVSTSSITGRALSQNGQPAVVDVAALSSGLPLAFAGGRDILLSNPLPASGVMHRVTTDSLGYFSIALPTSVVSSNVDLSFAEETGRDSYAKRSMSILTAADTEHDASIVLGEWQGGPEDDLSGQAYTPIVAYSTVQAIFSANCTGCHRASTTNNGGLDLTEGFSYAELVDQPSLFVPGLKLVEPGSPSRSYLFEKLNSPTPQQGTRMRPSDALPLADQALIRDWISQLAPSYENFIWTTFNIPPGSTDTGVDDVPPGSLVSNGLAYTQPSVALLSVSENSSPTQGELRLNADTTGLTLIIQVTDDLGGGSWTTVASRLRGQTNWQVSSGFSISETSPGVLEFSETATGASSRFYRFGMSEH